jgi:hypothetical protein
MEDINNFKDQAFKHASRLSLDKEQFVLERNGQYLVTDRDGMDSPAVVWGWKLIAQFISGRPDS